MVGFEFKILTQNTVRDGIPDRNDAISRRVVGLYYLFEHILNSFPVPSLMPVSFCHGLQEHLMLELSTKN